MYLLLLMYSERKIVGIIGYLVWSVSSGGWTMGNTCICIPMGLRWGGGDSVGSAWNHISGHVFASFLLPRTGGRCESRSTTDG